jgi:5'-nucleotidase / UDP-sugar diphosphatase
MKKIWQTSGIAAQLLAVILATPAFAEKVNITLLHMNDVYEISPVEGGTRGGLARVATLRKQLLAKNPRTYTLIAGDFLSPSAIGTAAVNGQRLAGKQMIASLNAMGLDYATFGNHEFDINAQQLNDRLKESKFQWFSSNVTTKAFPGVPPNRIINVKSDGGKTVRVGLIGLTIDSNPASYVQYTDPITAAKKQVAALKDKVDIIIALTHLSIAQDRDLIRSVPEINMVLGGHEHENIQQWRGRNFVPIFKADANARTVYIHNLVYDTDKPKSLEITSNLQLITDAIPDDPETATVVEKWVDIAFKAFEEMGFYPREKIATTTIYLDGLEESVRNRSTNLTEIIAQGMLQEVPTADLAIFNSGSIRIDDTIPPGIIIQYDVLRILPFGGKVLEVEMTGELLKQVLNQGERNRGTGGYLQTANITQDSSGNWLINRDNLDANRIYKVVINDFLLSGQEQGLGFLTRGNQGIKSIVEKRDIRDTTISQFQTLSATSNREIPVKMP